MITQEETYDKVAIVTGVTCYVKDEYFDSNGVRLHYTIEGEGEPVVLLHGLVLNSDSNWRLTGITETLAKDFRVITMDLRGHGLSGKPHDSEQYGLKMANDVLRLLDYLQIKKVHLVGYSLGGFITLKLAATHPQRLTTASALGTGWERPGESVFLSAVLRTLSQFEALLKVGKGIKPLSDHLGAGRQTPGELHAWGIKLMTGHFHDLGSLIAMIKNLPGLALSEEEVRTISKLVTEYFGDQEALVTMLRSLPDLALSEEEVRNIPVPMCAIIGSNDPFKDSAEDLVGLIPNYTFIVVDGADHIRTPMHAETPAALKGFLLQHRRK